MKTAQIVAWVVGLLFLSLGLQAKETNVRFGLKGSMNITRNWDSEGLSDSGYSTVIENKTTFALGVLASWRLSPRFHLQPEIYYIRKGARQNINVDGLPIGPIRVTYSMGYIEIPVLLKAYIKGDRELLGTHLVTGPYLSLLANDSYTVKNTYLGESTEDITGLQNIDYGRSVAERFQPRWKIERLRSLRRGRSVSLLFAALTILPDLLLPPPLPSCYNIDVCSVRLSCSTGSCF